MSKAKKAASFEDFLEAPSRLAKRSTQNVVAHSERSVPTKPLASRNSTRSKSSSRKEKVGLTIDVDIIDAIDDYIYHERKQGRRLKKNDVYEAALRQFLGMEGGDAL